MALDFGTIAQNYSVDHGTSVFSGSDTITILAWAKPDQTASQVHIWEIKDAASGELYWLSVIIGDLYCGMQDSSANRTRALGDSDQVAADTWQFFAGVLNRGGGSGAQKLFVGDLTTVPAEPGAYHGATTDGAVAVDVTGENFLIGGDTANEYWDDEIAWYAFYPYALTAAEIKQIYYHTRNRSGIPLTVASGSPSLWCLPGLHGKTNILDLSGNGYDGTGNANLVKTDHPPIGPAFGGVSELFYATSAADTNVNCAVDALTLTEYAATIVVDVNVSASVDALTLTEYAASLTADTNVTAAVVNLILSEYAASIANDVNVSASLAALALAEQAATILYGVNVLAAVDALTLTEYAASLVLDVNVLAAYDQLALTEYAATVDVGDVARPRRGLLLRVY